MIKVCLPISVSRQVTLLMEFLIIVLIIESCYYHVIGFIQLIGVSVDWLAEIYLTSLLTFCSLHLHTFGTDWCEEYRFEKDHVITFGFIKKRWTTCYTCLEGWPGVGMSGLLCGSVYCMCNYLKCNNIVIDVLWNMEMQILSLNVMYGFFLQI